MAIAAPNRHIGEQKNIMATLMIPSIISDIAIEPIMRDVKMPNMAPNDGPMVGTSFGKIKRIHVFMHHRYKRFCLAPSSYMKGPPYMMLSSEAA